MGQKISGTSVVFDVCHCSCSRIPCSLFSAWPAHNLAHDCRNSKRSRWFCVLSVLSGVKASSHSVPPMNTSDKLETSSPQLTVWMQILAPPRYIQTRQLREFAMRKRGRRTSTAVMLVCVCVCAGVDQLPSRTKSLIQGVPVVVRHPREGRLDRGASAHNQR